MKTLYKIALGLAGLSVAACTAYSSPRQRVACIPADMAPCYGMPSRSSETKTPPIPKPTPSSLEVRVDDGPSDSGPDAIAEGDPCCKGGYCIPPGRGH